MQHISHEWAILQIGELVLSNFYGIGLKDFVLNREEIADQIEMDYEGYGINLPNW